MQKICRRDFLKAIGLSATALTLGGCSEQLSQFPKDVQSKPNILLILVDDLGYGDLSSYGAKDLGTPNIDKLMAGGIRLDNFYANCPVCSPTRASLLTGRYPDLVGVPGVIRNEPENTFGYLHPKAVLLPKMLKKAGYHTALVGKWHLGLESPNTPNERGFDHFHGFLGDMMDDYFDHRRGGVNWMRLNDKEINPAGHATDLFTEWGIDYLKERAKSNQPFFLYLAYNAPHVPIQTPAGWVARVQSRNQSVSKKRAEIAAMIEHIDDGIGKVINTLQETGQAQNTLVIFTSDNGGQKRAGANNGNLNGNKGEMLEGGIKVPFCALWPAKIKPGSHNKDDVVLTMDIFPTICEVARVEIKHEIDARSFLSLLLGKEKKDRERYLFWVRREGWGMNGQAYHAARFGRWKLLQAKSPFEKFKLYDLKLDPLEQNPLSEAHLMYRQLFRQLQMHIIKAGAIPWHKGL
jgi:arylsulfatase A-like enzyme